MKKKRSDSDSDSGSGSDDDSPKAAAAADLIEPERQQSIDDLMDTGPEVILDPLDQRAQATDETDKIMMGG